MHLAERNVGRLVLGEQYGLVAVGDFGSAFDDDPVLSAVMVLLQAEAGFGFDLNALDLEAIGFVDAVVPTPRAVHLAMQGVLFAAIALQLADDGFDVLTATAVGN